LLEAGYRLPVKFVVIAVTGFNIETEFEYYRDCGFDKVLTKPASQTVISETLKLYKIHPC
jgi:hypothetical protein